MPIISKIGAKTWRVKLIYISLFTILVLGSITMLYPLALMLTGSVKSQTDLLEMTPYPAYWFDDVKLFQKYVESKYFVDAASVQSAWASPVFAFSKIDQPPTVDPELLDAYLQWRAECPWWILGNTYGAQMLPEQGRKWRDFCSQRFDDDLAAYNRYVGMPYTSWSDLIPPRQTVSRFPQTRSNRMQLFLEFADHQPIMYRILIDADGLFYNHYLLPTYTSDIERYNEAHGTDYASYDEIFLTHEPPVEGLARKDWDTFVRESLNFALIRLVVSDELTERYCNYLKTKYDGLITAYNHQHPNTPAIESFEQIALPASLPDGQTEQIDWAEFVRNPDLCPLDALRVYGPRQAFEKYLAERRGVSVDAVTPTRLPTAQADWHDTLTHAGALRWEFSTRNYKQVLDYIVLHGRGIRNTVIFCALAIGLALVVNPVAAFALSRYKPPSQYKILLLCMATMAFPPAVTMIPAFLLLKRFPLYPILGGMAVFIIVAWILFKTAHKMADYLKVLIAVLAGSAFGAFLLPFIVPTHVSLLNTFAALVLPSMANGYWIFLLKGFFDSLPRELFEAADLDGASEWTKFWSLTMGLSKPVLAVIALQAFRAAYTQFMMALILIPDQQMWTLMVWIFQLQSVSHQSTIYASLVLAAIPTLLVFIFAQGVIMRGIVVPTEK
jgi:multiple sugar transport system permease protein